MDLTSFYMTWNLSHVHAGVSVSPPGGVSDTHRCVVLIHTYVVEFGHFLLPTCLISIKPAQRTLRVEESFCKDISNTEGLSLVEILGCKSRLLCVHSRKNPLLLTRNGVFTEGEGRCKYGRRTVRINPALLGFPLEASV